MESDHITAEERLKGFPSLLEKLLNNVFWTMMMLGMLCVCLCVLTNEVNYVN
jgi:hypothetical protein